MIDVLIIAYKDKELPYTVNDLFAKAIRPDLLNVIVISQCEEFEDDRCVVHNIKQNKGLGYCRDYGYKLCNNEYYLQLPAHSRLISGWDDYLISNIKDNEVLVSPTMNYNREGEFDDRALFIQAGDLSDDLMNTYGVWYKPDFEGKETAFLTGVLFSKGRWIKDVPFDNRLFVRGDEVDMSVRTFDAGYKMRVIKPISYHLWHKGNAGRPKWNKKRPEEDKAYKLLNNKKVGKDREYPWDDFEAYKQKVKELKI